MDRERDRKGETIISDSPRDISFESILIQFFFSLSSPVVFIMTWWLTEDNVLGS